MSDIRTSLADLQEQRWTLSFGRDRSAQGTSHGETDRDHRVQSHSSRLRQLNREDLHLDSIIDERHSTVTDPSISVRSFTISGHDSHLSIGWTDRTGENASSSSRDHSSMDWTGRNASERRRSDLRNASDQWTVSRTAFHRTTVVGTSASFDRRLEESQGSEQIRSVDCQREDISLDVLHELRSIPTREKSVATNVSVQGSHRKGLALILLLHRLFSLFSSCVKWTDGCNLCLKHATLFSSNCKRVRRSIFNCNTSRNSVVSSNTGSNISNARWSRWLNRSLRSTRNFSVFERCKWKWTNGKRWSSSGWHRHRSTLSFVLSVNSSPDRSNASKWISLERNR